MPAQLRFLARLLVRLLVLQVAQDHLKVPLVQDLLPLLHHLQIVPANLEGLPVPFLRQPLELQVAQDPL